jgi:hypothetical protein
MVLTLRNQKANTPIQQTPSVEGQLIPFNKIFVLWNIAQRIYPIE